MLRWTSSFPIPTDNQQHDDVYCATVGKNIWFAPLQHSTGLEILTHLTVFDTETQEFRRVRCTYNGPIIPSRVFSLKSDENTLYMWAHIQNSRNVALFQLDTTTLIWSKKTSFPARGNIKVSKIGSRMYLLAGAIGRETAFLTVDLSTDPFDIDLEFIRRVDPEEVLLTNNGKVYLVEHIGRFRHMEVWRENDMVRFEKGNWTYNRTIPRHCNYEFAGGLLYYAGPGNAYFEKFNFRAEKWKKTMVEWCWDYRKLETIRGSCEVDGKVYVIVNPTGSQYELQILESKPSLITTCLLNLVVELADKSEAEISNVSNHLPLPIRPQFDNMIRWRVRDARVMDGEVPMVVQDPESERPRRPRPFRLGWRNE